jgi:DNA-binding NarL/FixJ family response regulator
MTWPALADQVGNCTATVKTHVNRAMVKVGARDRAQPVVFAHRRGLAD